MENEVNWGIPIKRVAKKVEKFSTPVVTLAALAKKGSGRKFSFNVASQELLNLVGGETCLNIGYDPEQNIFLQIAAKDEGLKITKSFSFSDKRTYEYIAKIKELNTEVENYFSIEPVEGKNYFQLVVLNDVDTTEETNNSEVEDTTKEPTKKSKNKAQASVEEEVTEDWA